MKLEMPRKYIRKCPDRKVCTQAQIDAAKKLIEEGNSKRMAAALIGIHESTLRKRLKLESTATSMGRFKPSFAHEQELRESQWQRTPFNSRKGGCNSDGDISKSFKVLKNVSTSTSVYDEASIFGEYIATKIRRMDPITALTVQHHIRNIIHQAEMGVYSLQVASVVKQESTVDESNHKITLCHGVKQEIIRSDLTALDGQIHTRDISMLFDVYGINTEQGGCIKDGVEEIDLDIGPTVLQPTDSYYKINQLKACLNNYGNVIEDEDSNSIALKRVKKEHIEDKLNAPDNAEAVTFCHVGSYEVESEDIEPTLLDSDYRSNEQKMCALKQESPIDNEGYNYDPISCSRVCVEDQCGDSNQQSTSSNSGVENAVIMHSTIGKLNTNIDTSTQQHNVVSIKKEVIDVELVKGSITVD